MKFIFQRNPNMNHCTKNIIKIKKIQKSQKTKKYFVFVHSSIILPLSLTKIPENK